MITADTISRHEFIGLDTKVIDSNNFAESTPKRSTLRAVQTPQGFSARILHRAHESGNDATDDAVLVEALGIPVRVVAGELNAHKITTPADLEWAKRLAKRFNVATIPF